MGLLRKEDMHESFWKEGISNPNLLINGDFQVWQRGTSFNYDSMNNFNIYTADRWRLIQGGTGSTAKVKKTSEIEENTLTITEFTKPSGIEMALSQKLDYPLQKEDGKNYTLSVSYSSNLNAKLCIREYDTDSVIASIPMPSSSNIKTVSLTFDSSKLSKKNNRVEIYVRFSSEEIYDNLTINLSNIKLEIGDHPTEFVPRLYGEELVLCQRYFKIMENGVAIPLAFYYDLNEKRILDFYLTLSTPLRIDPTLKTDEGTKIAIKDLLNNKNVNVDSITLSCVTRFENTASYLNIRTSIPLDTNVKFVSLYPNSGNVYLDAEIY